jgi:four helix bundle protein
MSNPIRSYRDLLVWQKAMNLIDRVDRIVEQLTPFQRNWIGLQMLRAALSIASNIAEGHDAESSKMYLRRLEDSKGSAREVETQLLVVRRRRNVQEEDVIASLAEIDEIGRMLRSLAKSIRMSGRRNPST